MEDSRLPAELERVERLLSRCPRPEPSAALRRRVLDDVRSELWAAASLVTSAKTELSSSALNSLRLELHREQARSQRRIAAAVAVTLLVGLSLLLGILQATSFALQQREFTPTLADIARQIQQISPQVSKKDSLHQAMLRQIGCEATCGTAVNRLLSEFQSHDP